MGRHGLNINSIGLDDDYVLELCKGTPANVIRNNPGLAQRIHDTYGTIAISRPDDTGQDDTDKYPEGLVGEWARDAYHGIWYYWPNEPLPSNGLKDFVDRSVSFLQECLDKQVKVCFGNFAWPAILKAPDVYAGRWDPLLKIWGQMAEKGLIILGGHEYTEGILAYGCAAMDPNKMRKEQDLTGGWPDWEMILSLKNANWHLFRWVPLYLRAISQGYTWPPYVITECFWDADEAESGLEGLYAQFNSWLGGQHPRGIINQRELFKYWFPNMSTLDAASAQLKWCEQVYPKFVIGFCHFTADKNQDWKLYNLLDWPELLKELPTI